MPRTLNDIIPPSRRRQFEAAEAAVFDAPPPPPTPRPSRRFPWGMVGVAAIVVLAAIGTLYAFGNAKVEITPNTNAISVSGTYTATPSSGDLPFELVTVDKVAFRSVAAEGTAQVNQPAQGTITIYNAQAKPQELVATTRFETPDGLVYRIRQGLSVPAGTASAPGTITATVYADANGERYNVGPTTFTLPGLAGSAQFDQVYAKSSAAMSGGFSGTRGTIGKATSDATHASLQSALETDLAAAAAAQTPDGYVLVPGAVFTSYESQPDSADASGQVVSSVKGTLQAVVFPKGALAHAVAAREVGGYTDQDVLLKDVSSLALAAASSAPPTASAPFSFNLTGNTTVVWQVDGSKIAGTIAGKSKSAADTLLRSYPEIAKAYLILRPFWRSTFPEDPAKITVTVDVPA